MQSLQSKSINKEKRLCILGELLSPLCCEGFLSCQVLMIKMFPGCQTHSSVVSALIAQKSDSLKPKPTEIWRTHKQGRDIKGATRNFHLLIRKVSYQCRKVFVASTHFWMTCCFSFVVIFIFWLSGRVDANHVTYGAHEVTDSSWLELWLVSSSSSSSPVGGEDGRNTEKEAKGKEQSKKVVGSTRKSKESFLPRKFVGRATQHWGWVQWISQWIMHQSQQYRLWKRCWCVHHSSVFTSPRLLYTCYM